VVRVVVVLVCSLEQPDAHATTPISAIAATNIPLAFILPSSFASEG
jgi:hypothetical protein